MSGAALVVVLVFVPLLALVARRRWRLAEARREEVRRLLRLAAEETARAEIESVLAYGSGPGPIPAAATADGDAGRPQCAVCSSPTTTRCSRCKTIRYCSGRCQIIHWRQGHREECHPPRFDDQHNGTRSVYNLKAVQAEQSDLCDNDSEIEGQPHVKSVGRSCEGPSSESNSPEVFRDDDNHEVRPFVDTSGTDSTSDSLADSLSHKSSSSSSSCSTFSGPVETSHDTSSSKDPSLLHNANVRELFPQDVSPDNPRTEVDAGDTNLTKALPAEFSSVGLSANISSCTSDSNQKASSCELEEVDGGPSGPFGSGTVSDNCKNAEPSEDTSECQDTIFDSSGSPCAGVVNSTDCQLYEESDRMQLDDGSPLQISSKSAQGMPSQPTSANENSCHKAAPAEVTAHLDLRDSKDLGFDKSGSFGRGRSNDVLLVKPKGLNSLSSVPSAGHASSTGGGHPISRDTFLNMGNAPPVRTKFSEGTGSVSNGIYDLKTSVRRVVQQFKPSQILRHSPSAFGSDIPGKYKMLFPYDHFIKLYNCDKVELRPCGLTNCGNSCYANAVLQCLAFTRPLTAYLLQGLHTKTCPKREWCFTCEFESLLMKAKEGQSPLSPIGILSHIHKIGSHLGYGQEEDAHEFLRYAIDAMQSVCLKEAGANAVGPLAEETTLIQLMFGGYLLSKIKCMRCRGQSERHERMMDLTVEIHGDIGTLEEALSRFTATENLDGDNKYQCNRCKSYERAKKKLTILEAPNVLTIALKRFQSGKFGKINKAVRFPEYLDLAPYMSGTDDKSPVYRLYAVVVHLDIMNAAFSGHYVCYVKSTQKKWYKIDDSKVQPVDLERVLSKNAYLLLYARCSPRAPSLIRQTMSHEHVKNKRNKYKEAVLSGYSGESHVSKTRSAPTTLRPGLSAALYRSQDYPYRPPNHSAGFQPSDLFDERFLFPRMDSSSDSSSLLSCSDEGSCSTESTRDSTSTEDFSEYSFGDSARLSWSSSSGFSDDSDRFAHSPLLSRHAPEAVSNGHKPDRPNNGVRLSDFSSSGREDAGRTGVLSYGDRRPRESKEVRFQGEGSPPFLDSDTTNQCRKLTEQCRSRETDWVNPYEVKSGVSMRRSTTRERTAQTSDR